MWRLGVIGVAAAALAAAQAPVRITQPVNLSQTVRLRGNTIWRHHAVLDRGAAPPDLVLNHMLLLLRRSPQQQAALDRLLTEQQQPGSPQFHHWLTPAEFGAQFGPSPQDLTTVEQWLAGQGFQIESTPPGGLVIEFSGTAAQMQQGLHTSIHRFQAANGANYWANAADPAIPSALAPVVAGVVSLNNFPSHPTGHLMAHGRGQKPGPGQISPALNFTYNGFVNRALVPGDFATIYNVNPLLQSGITGTGETVAIVARSDVNPVDEDQFRALFQPTAPANVLTIVQATASDPGQTKNEDQDEATLDTEWSGAAAPDAKLDLVVAASTATTDGVDLAAAYIVNHNLAPIVTVSFGQCEAQMGATENQYWNNLWQQATAQGMTVLVSAGDDGPAGCDPDTATQATQGLAVSGLASTPYDTAVGGTMFAEGSGSYWSDTAAADYSSALSYIPEQPWDEVNEAINGGGIWSGSGGASSIYARPGWQLAPGVPVTGTERLLPDLALSAALHDGYVVCENLTCALSDGSFEFAVFSGTSAASPAFAGMMALVDQRQNSRQGLAAPFLYQLAANEPTAQCNSSSGPAASCTINDVTTGNNFVPCASGSPDCGAMGTMGFSAAPGFDEASGLGSVNAANLVANWSRVGQAGSQVVLTISPPANATFGQQIPLTVTVTGASSGGPAPSGTVELLATINGADQPLAALALGAQGTLATTTEQLPAGTYNVVARYHGDGHYASSQSAPVSVTVAKASAKVGLIVYATSPSQPVTSAIYGPVLYAQVTVAGPAGAPPSTGFVSVSPPATDVGAQFTSESQDLGPGGVTTLQGALWAPVGAHSLVAHFAGGNNLLPADSAPVTIQILPSPTSVVIAPMGGNMLSVIMKTQSDSRTPSFFNAYNGTTLIGSSGGGTIEFDPATGFAQLDSSYQLPVLSGTSATITVKIPGDGNFLPSTSNTITVATPPNLVFSSASLTFGTVAFGQTSPPQTVTLTNQGGTTDSFYLSVQSSKDDYSQTDNCGNALAPGASCTISITFHPVGTDAATGNGNSSLFVDPYSGSYSASLSLAGTGEGFYLYVAPGVGGTFTPGQSQTFVFSAIPVGGYTGPVTLSCANLPPNSTCSFSPATLTLDGTNTVPVTVTLTTTANTAVGGQSGGFPWIPIFLVAAGGLGADCWLRRRSTLAPRLAALALLLLAAAACGGGTAVSPPPPPPLGGGNGGPPAGPLPTIEFGNQPSNFGEVAVGYTSESEELTVYNNDPLTTTITINSIVITGADSSEFQQSNTCGQVLQSTCNVSVTFAPTAAGNATANLVITSSAGNSPSTIPLAGTAVTGTPGGSYTFLVNAASPGQPTESVPISVFVN